MHKGSHAGEVALVTGANKGLGLEIARRLAGEGLVVYLGARDEQRGLEAAEELRAEGGDVRFVQLDVTKQAEIEAAVARIEAESGQLNGLVNNAGVLLELDTPVVKTSADRLRDTFDVNVVGVVALRSLAFRCCDVPLRRGS